MKICFENSPNYDKQKKADEDLPSACTACAVPLGYVGGRSSALPLSLPTCKVTKYFLNKGLESV